METRNNKNKRIESFSFFDLVEQLSRIHFKRRRISIFPVRVSERWTKESLIRCLWVTVPRRTGCYVPEHTGRGGVAIVGERRRLRRLKGASRQSGISREIPRIELQSEWKPNSWWIRSRRWADSRCLVSHFPWILPAFSRLFLSGIPSYGPELAQEKFY